MRTDEEEAQHVEWDIRRVERTESTNADAAAAARRGAAHGFVVVADHQQAGRGRLDRVWHTPRGTALTASFVLRPDVPAARWPWLPLLTGVAVVDAVAEVSGVSAQVKWPNDVLVGDRKLAGILVERIETPTGPAAIVGIGLNVAQPAVDLPDTGTSLALAGAGAKASGLTPDAVLTAVTTHLARRYDLWTAAAGDPAAGLAAAYRERSATIGQQVRAELPGGGVLAGAAIGVDGSGRLVIDPGSDLAPTPVGAGDIVHLRPRLVPATVPERFSSEA